MATAPFDARQFVRDRLSEREQPKQEAPALPAPPRLPAYVPPAMASIISEAGDRYQIPSRDLAIAAKLESNFNPRAVNPESGAEGMYQQHPPAHPNYRLGTGDPVYQTDYAGSQYAPAYNRYGKDSEKALTSWFGGVGTVDRAIAKSPQDWRLGLPPKTAEYNRKVQAALAESGAPTAVAATATRADPAQKRWMATPYQPPAPKAPKPELAAPPPASPERQEAARAFARKAAYERMNPLEKGAFMVTQPLKRGWHQAGQSSNVATTLLGLESPESAAADIAARTERLADYPRPFYAEEASQRAIAAGGDLGDFLAEMAKDPRAMLDVSLEASVSSLPGLVGRFLLAPLGAVAGFFTGGPPGATIGWEAGSATGTGAGSYMAEFGGSVLENFSRNGVDLRDPVQIRAAFDDDRLMAESVKYANVKAGPIAAADAALSVGAGRFLPPIAGTLTRMGMGKAGAYTLGSAAELGIQMAGSGAGEAAGQASESYVRTGKAEVGDWGAVAAEIVGEGLPGAVEVAHGLAGRKYLSMPPKGPAQAATEAAINAGGGPPTPAPPAAGGTAPTAPPSATGATPEAPKDIPGHVLYGQEPDAGTPGAPPPGPTPPQAPPGAPQPGEPNGGPQAGTPEDQARVDAFLAEKRQKEAEAAGKTFPLTDAAGRRYRIVPSGGVSADDRTLINPVTGEIREYAEPTAKQEPPNVEQPAGQPAPNVPAGMAQAEGQPAQPAAPAPLERPAAGGQPTAGPAAEGTGQAPAVDLPRIQVGPRPDGVGNQMAQQSRDIADRIGITPIIEDLAAQGLTAAQVVDRLKNDGKLEQVPQDEWTNLVVGTRATLGIPSQATEEGKAEFQQWLQERNQRKMAAITAPTTPITQEKPSEEAQPAPAAGIPAQEARPEAGGVQGRSVPAPAATSQDAAAAKGEVVETARAPTNPANVQRVVGARGTAVDTEYEVVELADLKAASGQFQPRDRSKDPAYEAQIQRIVREFEPEKMGRSPEADKGAPIVGPDNMIESGNGRRMALERIYAGEPAKADAYRKMIEAQGFDVAGKTQPVLVRRRLNAMTPQQRTAWADEANEAGLAALTSDERARMDARAMTPELLRTFAPNSELSTATNQRFVSEFAKSVGADPREFFQDGVLTVQGLSRVKNAMLSAAYGGDESSNMIVRDILTHTDPDVGKQLSDIMTAHAPGFLELKARAADRMVDPSVADLSRKMASAVQFINNSRGQGKNPIAELSTADLFSGQVDPDVATMVRGLLNEQGTALRPKKFINEFFDSALRNARSTERPSATQAIEDAFKQASGTYVPPAQVGLFSMPQPPAAPATEPTAPTPPVAASAAAPTANAALSMPPAPTPAPTQPPAASEAKREQVVDVPFKFSIYREPDGTYSYEGKTGKAGGFATEDAAYAAAEGKSAPAAAAPVANAAPAAPTFKPVGENAGALPPNAPTPSDWRAKWRTLEVAPGKWRIAGLNNANPISPSFATEQEAEVWADREFGQQVPATAKTPAEAMTHVLPEGTGYYDYSRGMADFKRTPAAMQIRLTDRKGANPGTRMAVTAEGKEIEVAPNTIKQIEAAKQAEATPTRIQSYKTIRSLSDQEIRDRLAAAEASEDDPNETRYRGERNNRNRIKEIDAEIAELGAAKSKKKSEALKDLKAERERRTGPVPEANYAFTMDVDGQPVDVTFELNHSAVSYYITGASQVSFGFERLPAEYSGTGVLSHITVASVDQIPTQAEVEREARSILEARKAEVAKRARADKAAEAAAKKRAEKSEATETTASAETVSEVRADVQAAYDKYNDGDEATTVQDLAESLDGIDGLPEELSSALESYREAAQEDLDEWGGRGDQDAYEGELIAALEKYLQQPAQAQATEQQGEAGEKVEDFGFPHADTVQSIEDAEARLDAGTLAQNPEKEQHCHELAFRTATTIPGAKQVIGTIDDGAGKRIWHSVVLLPDSRIVDATLNDGHNAFAPGVYEELTDFQAVRSLTTREAMSIAQSTGKIPDQVVLGLRAIIRPREAVKASTETTSPAADQAIAEQEGDETDPDHPVNLNAREERIVAIPTTRKSQGMDTLSIRVAASGQGFKQKYLAYTPESQDYTNWSDEVYPTREAAIEAAKKQAAESAAKRLDLQYRVRSDMAEVKKSPHIKDLEKIIKYGGLTPPTFESVKADIARQKLAQAKRDAENVGPATDKNSESVELSPKVNEYLDGIEQMMRENGESGIGETEIYMGFGYADPAAFGKIENLRPKGEIKDIAQAPKEISEAISHVTNNPWRYPVVGIDERSPDITYTLSEDAPRGVEERYEPFTSPEETDAEQADESGESEQEIPWPAPTMEPSRNFADQKTKVNLPMTRKGVPGMAEIPQEQADGYVEQWKEYAQRVGREEDHSNEVIISLFDVTGGWSQPYVDAGYDVRRYDIQSGDDLARFTPTADIREIIESGKKIVGVLAAPPCTSFSSSGAQWWKPQHDVADSSMVARKYGLWASKYFDTPSEYAKYLVEVTRVIVEMANPSLFHVLENPVGRIQSMTGLPEDPTLAFDPHHFGSPYTKRTQLWGEFNPKLPTANVHPTKGSWIHQLRGDVDEDKAERSETPLEFAYAFFAANNTSKIPFTPSAEIAPAPKPKREYRNQPGFGPDFKPGANDRAEARSLWKESEVGYTYRRIQDTLPLHGPRMTAKRLSETIGNPSKEGETVPLSVIKLALNELVQDGRVVPDGRGFRINEANRPLPPAAPKKTYRLTKKDREARAELQRVYSPGNIVKSYFGFDRVLSFQPWDENGQWSVTVRAVMKDADGNWVDAPNEVPRTHRTRHDKGDLILEAKPTVAGQSDFVASVRQPPAARPWKSASDGPLPKQVVDAFVALGEAQRGAPEAAMVKYGKEFAGVMAPALEHIGDLTHRMTHMLKWGDKEDGLEYAGNKVEKTLRWLTSKYGFDREHKENIAVSAKTRTEYWSANDLIGAERRSEMLMQAYAREHEKLPVYNRAQWLAREAAIQLGRGRTFAAIKALRELEGMMADPAAWNRHATAYRLGPDGKPEQYQDPFAASRHVRVVSGGAPSTESVTSAVQAALSPDLLSPEWRAKAAKSKSKFCGHCYAAAEAAYYLLGGKAAGWAAHVLSNKTWPEGLEPGETHWFIKHADGEIVDPTAEQFDGPIAYDRAKATGFLTGDPSRRAQIIIERARTSAGPVWYSPAKRLVEAGPEKASGQNWLAYLKNKGAKAEELAWTGVEEWLSQQNRQVTKRELSAYLDANELRVETVVLKEPSEGRRNKLLSEQTAIVEEWKSLGLSLEGDPIDGPYLVWMEGTPNADEVAVWAYEEPGDDVPDRALDLWSRYAEIDAELGLTYESPDGYRNSKAPRWHTSGYVTPGGTEHTELVLTLPGQIEPYDITDTNHYGDVGGGTAVAWIRGATHTDADGKRVFLIDEVQSKRHQKGRKEGYASQERKKGRVVEQEGGLWKIQWEDGTFSGGYGSREWAEEAMAGRAERPGIPDAPFKTTWPELALKRAIRWAAENGYDRIAWTPGEVQADRYDLSKQVRSLSWDHITVGGRDTVSLTAAKHTGDEASLGTHDRGKLADVVGKEVAERINASIERGNTSGILTGLDLKVGGEGMRGFYDKILVDAANRLGKKFGAKVGRTEIKTVQPFLAEMKDRGYEFRTHRRTTATYEIQGRRPPGEYTRGREWQTIERAPLFNTEREALDYINKGAGGQAAHSLDITPQMRESVMQGQPMFSRRQPESLSPRDRAKGTVVVDKNGDPLMVFYGSPSAIVGDFDPNHPNRRDSGFIGIGLYAQSAVDIANWYARNGAQISPIVYPLYVKLTNPYEATLADKARLQRIYNRNPAVGRQAAERWTNELKAKGHDGVILKMNPSEFRPEGSMEIVVFDPRNAFSAISGEGMAAQREETRGTGLRASEVAAAVQPIESEFANLELTIVQTLDDLRAIIGDHPLIRNGLAGMYRRGTDEIYLVADEIPSIEAARRELAHEIGHLAVERYADMTKLHAAVMSAQGSTDPAQALLAGLWRSVQYDYADQTPDAQAYEVMARMAEGNIRHPLLDEIISLVRDFFRTRIPGFADMKFSDREIRGMIARSIRKYRAEHEGVVPVSSTDIGEEQVDALVASLRTPDLPEAAVPKWIQALRFNAPFERLARLPFRLMGMLNEKNEFIYGVKASKELENLIKNWKPSPNAPYAGWLGKWLEVMRWGLLDRFGVPEGYVEHDNARATARRIIEQQGLAFAKAIDDPEAALILGKIMVGEAVDEGQFGTLPQDIRAAISKLGLMLYQMGYISKESYERNLPIYMHRVFEESEKARYEGPVAGWISRTLRGRRVRIVGDELKERGLSWMVGQDRLLRDVPTDGKAAQEVPWHGVQRVPGKADPQMLGHKFRLLDLVEDQGDRNLTLEGIEAAVKTPKVKRRVWWPLETPLPAKYADYTDRGTYIVRDIVGGEYKMWRDLTKEERTQLGEILDARYIIARTFELLARDVSTGQFYRDLSRDPRATWLDPEGPPPAETIVPEGSKSIASMVGYEWIKLDENTVAGTKAKRWGDLAGKYIRVEVYKDLMEYGRMSQSGPWSQLLEWWKLNKTARNPVVHANNFFANIGLADLIDVTITDILEGFHHYIKQDDWYKEAAEARAFGVGMADQELNKFLRNLYEEMQGKSKAGAFDGFMGRLRFFDQMARIVSEGTALLKKADTTMLNAYSASDDIFRMGTYVKYRRLGYPPAEAAQLARDEFLNYDIRAPWINAARRSVLPFLSYTYRAVPVIADAIMKRPWKLAKYFLLYEVANAVAYAISGGDEDWERKNLAARDQGRSWMGGVHLMWRYPANDGYGRPLFQDIRRFMPAGDILETNPNSVVPIPMWLQFGGPAAIVGELVFNKALFTGKEIYNPLIDTPAEVAGKWAAHTYRQLAPSAPWIPGSWYWNKIRDSLGTDALMQEVSTPQAILSSVGWKVKPLDVPLQQHYNALEYQRTVRALRTEFNANERQRQRGLISESAYEAKRNSLTEKIGKLNEKFVEKVGQ